jgi:Uncharacterized protein conserved in bacteria (DUF2255)
MCAPITEGDRAGTQPPLRQKVARITVADLKYDVLFEPVEGPINTRIDDAYRAKYHASRYLDDMIGDRARAATVIAKTGTRMLKAILPLLISLAAFLCTAVFAVIGYRHEQRRIQVVRSAKSKAAAKPDQPSPVRGEVLG